MKIKIVKYIDREVRIVLENDPYITHGLDGNGEPTEHIGTRTFCFPLTQTTTKQEIIDALKAKIQPPDTTEQIFNDLNLAGLVGTDI